MEVTHTYPDLTVHLTLLNASIRSGVPQLLEHQDMRWITPGEIAGLPSAPPTRSFWKNSNRYKTALCRKTPQRIGFSLPGFCHSGRESPSQKGDIGLAISSLQKESLQICRDFYFSQHFTLHTMPNRNAAAYWRGTGGRWCCTARCKRSDTLFSPSFRRCSAAENASISRSFYGSPRNNPHRFSYMES